MNPGQPRSAQALAIHYDLNLHARASRGTEGAAPTERILLPKLTIIILTKDEEIHLERALQSADQIAAENHVLVVDSFSTDNTVDIAISSGARVIQRQFVNQAEQFNWALTQADADTDWILRLDADEVMSEALAKELTDFLSSPPPGVTHAFLPRQHVFLQKQLKHGGRQNVRMLRLWRPACAHVEMRWMDEHVIADSGLAYHAQNPFFDWNLKDLSFFTHKHTDYATREAVATLLTIDSNSDKGLHAQARFKRNLKHSVFNRIPYPIAALGYFLIRYVIQLGFMDGTPGLVYHSLQGMWYRFLVGARISELRAIINGAANTDEVVDRLEKSTGLRIKDHARLSTSIITGSSNPTA